MTLFEQQADEFQFVQVGFVVPDVVEASRRWAAVHGIGPFHLLRPVEQTLTCGERSMTVQMQAGVAWAGPLQIELIQQHDDAPSIYSGWNGMHQICTVTHDFEAKTAHYSALGYDVWFSAGSFRVAYVDTTADFGFFTEIVLHNKAFLDSLAVLERTCATWDGHTDPVRLLTRDGYKAL